MVNTVFLLMAQYNGAAVIPLDDVLRDYFGGQSRVEFLAKVERGEIKIPVTRMEQSQRGMVGIGLVDLAEYIDARFAAAREENEAMSR
jgi:hypothetical protein